ncbi:uncharacterized protein F4817DRAFT_315800 [Daldinia loculata]|uniref:uncharacterized protein n=1 Tax=Daldinia loculata TaxID=103429 RepID=UPI0020C3DE9A|nr:uncharacterized protein F4817DRAFT_315800 [Daldinia loculata]KAI1647323.1 hypothetical protein F4817DRAFT_315800 [Daldinia loculata]
MITSTLVYMHTKQNTRRILRNYLPEDPAELPWRPDHYPGYVGGDEEGGYDYSGVRAATLVPLPLPLSSPAVSLFPDIYLGEGNGNNRDDDDGHDGGVLVERRARGPWRRPHARPEEPDVRVAEQRNGVDGRFPNCNTVALRELLRIAVDTALEGMGRVRPIPGGRPPAARHNAGGRPSQCLDRDSRGFVPLCVRALLELPSVSTATKTFRSISTTATTHLNTLTGIGAFSFLFALTAAEPLLRDPKRNPLLTQVPVCSAFPTDQKWNPLLETCSSENRTPYTLSRGGTKQYGNNFVVPRGTLT